MYGWHNFVDKCKRYFPLERPEKLGLLFTSLVTGFIFFQYLSYYYKDWAAVNTNVSTGVVNLIITILIVAAILGIRELSHRTTAVLLGYKTQYKSWLIGLVVGLVLTFLSNGAIFFITPGLLEVIHLEAHRLGKAHYGFSLKHVGWIAMAGPIVVIFCSVILKTLSVWTGIALFEKAVTIAIWIALFDMIPIPPFNGSKTFFGSRYIYMFVLGAVIGCAALLTFMGGILPIVVAFILGSITLFMFFVYVDKKW